MNYLDKNNQVISVGALVHVFCAMRRELFEGTVTQIDRAPLAITVKLTQCANTFDHKAGKQVAHLPGDTVFKPLQGKFNAAGDFVCESTSPRGQYFSVEVVK